ncbi:Vacuolar sorting protein 9 subgroup [Penicillium maclennaniae]|uniref:Vacuolar sorting protein 9 subgroup n=1 Tax=Penicillium maclennaniae TaxID=1343394 RepID=UPI00253FA2CF|nr:Vacuolar sorting protein 9 subgroup [Penicillium maclennaniae]KAJ5666277.1 Vacuolar sorting protein 9 subgroup [Penicillium maclennaniae]
MDLGLNRIPLGRSAWKAQMPAPLVSTQRAANEPGNETTTKSATDPVNTTTQHSSPSDEKKQKNDTDVFEKRSSTTSGGTGDGQADEGFVLSRSVQDPSEELPIELVSLTDRFINSLSAKVHNSPPTIDKISSLFQVFYDRAESHIATHISALASRINRESTPQVPPRVRGSGLSRLTNKGSQDDLRSSGLGRQMLTPDEVEERRKARKALEYKRAAMEEAAERRVCEQVYDKIWRHKSTLDEVRDEKLRSKTAALLLVGIDLKDLGIDLDISTISEEKQQEANDCLALARECLEKMSDQKYPLGKLQQLAAAHKAIVDALTKLLPSSSSADEILPTLIYCLVTCPPEGINIVSNLTFIQRFRSSNKIDGETAYCLTNLEAAISFLENVELSSLRADELQEGPAKTPSEAATPSSERVDPFRPTKDHTTSSITIVSAEPEISQPEVKEPAVSTLPRPRPSVTPQQRRLSNLFQPPVKVFEAANDAVRSTADQSFKNIGASLDNSFNFLFGRLKELQTTQGPNAQGNGTLLPKTLAEARRLVANPPANNQILTPEEMASINDISAEDVAQGRSSSRSTLTSGGPTPRDRSTDSARTQGSSKMSVATSLRDEPAQSPASVTTPNPLESMRSFGNTLNPLNHIPGMIKNFGRITPDTPTARSVSPAAMDRLKTSPSSSGGVSGAGSFLPAYSKIEPPIQRFLETKDASDLRVGDIAILLQDYKRLAASLYQPGPGSR